MTGFESKRQASKSLAANTWRDAINDELICTHLGTADSFPDPKDALNALIDWHVAVALDPEVSSEAQALIDRGRAAVVEPLTERRIYELHEVSRLSTVRFARAIEQAHGIGITGDSK